MPSRKNFFGRVLKLAEPHQSDEHFTVDGTLIEAWASQKSFRRKDGSDDGDGANFHGTQLKNDTHPSTTDPDARLYRKSSNAESKLSCLGAHAGERYCGAFPRASTGKFFRRWPQTVGVSRVR